MEEAQVPSRVVCLEPDHNSEVAIFGCDTCDKLICRMCVTSTHKQHDFCQVNEFVNIRKSKISKAFNDLERREIPAVDDLEMKLKTAIDDLNREREKRLGNVNRRYEKLLNELKQVYNAKLGEIDEIFQDYELLCSLQTVQSRRKQLATIGDVLQQKMKSTSDFEIVEFSDKLETLVPYTLPQILPFAAGCEPEQLLTDHGAGLSMENLFGHFKAVPKREKYSLSFENVSSFVFDENFFIKYIFVVDEKKAWIFNESKNMNLVNDQGKSEISINLDFNVKDLILMSTGNILVSVDGGTELRYLTLSGKWELFHNASPYKTRGMCLARNGDVIACVYQSSKPGKLLRLSPCGKLVQEIQDARDGSVLFQLADRVTENVNDDLVVIDWKEKWVVAIDNKMNKRFAYSGQPGTKLTPYGLTNDSSGRIFISDKVGHNVHIIDKNGQFLQIFSFPSSMLKALVSPRRVSFGPDGRLWIGCDKGKIHCVQFCIETSV